MSLTLLPLLIAAAWFSVSLLRRHGHRLPPTLAQRAGLAALAAAAVFLLARQFALASALGAAGAGLLLAPGGGGSRRWRPGTGRAPSRVETAALAMELDPADGSMDGTVRTGAFAGQRLSAMDREALLRLVAEIDAQDEASLRLLGGYLDWRFPGWRDEAQEATDPGAGPMSRREALTTLGLDEGADAEAIRAAHRRLMKKVHPDQGGSAALAARVQAARDTLLG
jgi:hypothetical protein